MTNKQTNEYQQLVRNIQRLSLPKEAVVTESALLGESSREIDILIQSVIGEYKIKIAVEVKDESRPMTLDRIEAYVAKYRPDGGLGINKVAIVTRKGFSPKALELGQKVGFELMTIDEAISSDDLLDKDPFQQIDRFTLFRTKIEVYGINSLRCDLSEEFLKNGLVFCNASKRECGSIFRVIEESINTDIQDRNPKIWDILRSMKFDNGNPIFELKAEMEDCFLIYGSSSIELYEVYARLYFEGFAGGFNYDLYAQDSNSTNTRLYATSDFRMNGKDYTITLPDPSIENFHLRIDEKYRGTEKGGQKRGQKRG